MQTIDEIEVVADPQLTVVACRLVRVGLSEEELNALNHTFLEQINAVGKVMLTSTLLDGRFVLRICVLSFRTHATNIDDCVEAIRGAIADV